MRVRSDQAGLLAENKFDVIVIGSGMGGLTSAALLARAGKKVLVIEQHDRPGGYVHGFKRKNYVFDAGVHITSGCGAVGYKGGQLIHKTLKVLGVDHELEFIKVNPFCHVIYPGFKLEFPQKGNALIDVLAVYFPDQRESLQAFIALCLKVTEQAVIADELIQSNDPERIRLQLAEMLKYRKSTLAEVLEQFISDEKLHSILACSWPYLGLPPSQISFLYWANMFIGYLEDGAYYCKGGFQNLANVMVSGIRKFGGEILYKQKVNGILVENNKAHAVTVDNGYRYHAPIVISNADMNLTINDWVGSDYFPVSYLNSLGKMEHSVSIFVVYLATSLDLSGFGAETFCYDGFDLDQQYLKTCRGDISWLSITIPTLNDHTLAPEGQHLVTLTTLLPFELFKPWADHKVAVQNQMLELAERYIPGLNEHLLFVESGSPQTMHRYTGNGHGAAYGWATTPGQVGPYRARQDAPVQGLYFAGHWTKPGGGVYGVSVSGLKVAQLILGLPKQKDFWDRLCD